MEEQDPSGPHPPKPHGEKRAGGATRSRRGCRCLPHPTQLPALLNLPLAKQIPAGPLPCSGLSADSPRWHRAVPGPRCPPSRRDPCGPLLLPQAGLGGWDPCLGGQSQPQGCRHCLVCWCHLVRRTGLLSLGCQTDFSDPKLGSWLWGGSSGQLAARLGAHPVPGLHRFFPNASLLSKHIPSFQTHPSFPKAAER